ncbi:MAG: hypothetical protein V1921_06640 [Candidatus Altiarchaeota archaeon]
MTGTKVVKLKLDAEGVGDKLPKLKDPIVEAAVRVFDENEWVSDAFTDYNNLDEKLQGISVTEDGLNRVIEIIEASHEPDGALKRNLGLFVTALVKNSPKNRFTVRAKNPLTYLGFAMDKGKGITVEGDVGDMTGYHMAGGRVTVKGNAKDGTGCNMVAGRIVVEGNARDGTGDMMKGGILDVLGEIREISNNIYGGEVRHKGVKVAP